MVVHPSSPTLARWRQKDPEFKAILYCITSNSMGYMRSCQRKKRERRGETVQIPWIWGIQKAVDRLMWVLSSNVHD